MLKYYYKLKGKKECLLLDTPPTDITELSPLANYHDIPKYIENRNKYVSGSEVIYSKHSFDTLYDAISKKHIIKFNDTANSIIQVFPLLSDIINNDKSSFNSFTKLLYSKIVSACVKSDRSNLVYKYTDTTGKDYYYRDESYLNFVWYLISKVDIKIYLNKYTVNLLEIVGDFLEEIKSLIGVNSFKYWITTDKGDVIFSVRCTYYPENIRKLDHYKYLIDDGWYTKLRIYYIKLEEGLNRIRKIETILFSINTLFNENIHEYKLKGFIKIDLDDITDLEELKLLDKRLSKIFSSYSRYKLNIKYITPTSFKLKGVYIYSL